MSTKHISYLEALNLKASQRTAGVKVSLYVTPQGVFVRIGRATYSTYQAALAYLQFLTSQVVDNGTRN